MPCLIYAWKRMSPVPGDTEGRQVKFFQNFEIGGWLESSCTKRVMAHYFVDRGSPHSVCVYRSKLYDGIPTLSTIGTRIGVLWRRYGWERGPGERDPIVPFTLHSQGRVPVPSNDSSNQLPWQPRIPPVVRAALRLADAEGRFLPDHPSRPTAQRGPDRSWG